MCILNPSHRVRDENREPVFLTRIQTAQLLRCEGVEFYTATDLASGVKGSSNHLLGYTISTINAGEGTYTALDGCSPWLGPALGACRFEWSPQPRLNICVTDARGLIMAT